MHPAAVGRIADDMQGLFARLRIDGVFCITDFCMAYLQFLDGKDKLDPQFWQKNNASPRLNTWRGFAFEELCFSSVLLLSQNHY